MALRYFWLILWFLASCSELYPVGAGASRWPWGVKNEGWPLQTRAPEGAFNALSANLRPLVVIDAGHGGKDKGTTSLSLPRVEEKTLALSTAFFLQGYLRKLGFRTSMLRADDSFIPLQERVERSNTQKPLLFVSIHYNAAKNILAEGIEIYYFQGEQKDSRSESSKILASHILAKMLQTTLAKSRGTKHGNLAVVRDTLMPAVLVEGGFMTNEAEMARLRDSKYQRRIAWGIALGIRDFFSLPTKLSK